jgi:hypothetical protein
LAGLLAEHYGLSVGGIRLVSQVTGLAEKTIQRGLREIENELEGGPGVENGCASKLVVLISISVKCKRVTVKIKFVYL